MSSSMARSACRIDGSQNMYLRSLFPDLLPKISSVASLKRLRALVPNVSSLSSRSVSESTLNMDEKRTSMLKRSIHSQQSMASPRASCARMMPSSVDIRLWIVGSLFNRFLIEKAGLRLFRAHDQPSTGPCPFVSLVKIDGTPCVKALNRFVPSGTLSNPSMPISSGLPESTVLTIFTSVTTKTFSPGSSIRIRKYLPFFRVALSIHWHTVFLFVIALMF
mmetsp:Transcript_57109/g.140100  ORF Transcript_57109/g.140100 Transcript_57109/m.140100 type:complete len:220 (-) Transcript_57109:334-993(-)